MPLAIQSDAACPQCGSDVVFEYTKAGESTRRLTCDPCGAEWSIPT